MSRPNDMVALETDAPGLEARFEPFAAALEQKFGMPEEDALATARIVADAFGQAEEVDDEALDPDVRSVFYTLEEKDLLTFDRETFESEDGQTLRAYYWRICSDELKQISEQLADEDTEPGVYDELPNDVWSARNT